MLHGLIAVIVWFAETVAFVWYPVRILALVVGAACLAARAGGVGIGVYVIGRALLGAAAGSKPAGPSGREEAD